MAHRLRNLLFLALLCSVLLGPLAVRPVLALSVSPSTSSQQEIVVAVPFPGVARDCAAPEHFRNGQPLKCVGNLSDYIAAFYKFFSGAVGVLAAVMIMWGGYKWLTAAGNSSRVSDARDTINSAIVAIILTLGAYILLSTINPQLVALQLPGIQEVTKVELGASLCRDNDVSVIDFSGCDPRLENCCGQTTPLKGTAVDSCYWDVTPNRLQVCGSQNPDAKSDPSTFVVANAETFCETTHGDVDSWCTYANDVIQQASTYTTFGTSVRKFTQTGCGHTDVFLTTSGGCFWGLKFSAITAKEFGDQQPNYEPKFVDCFTPGAEGVCWEQSNGTKTPKTCNGATIGIKQKCASAATGIVGANGGCLVKLGKTGSTDANDYKCWAVPSDLRSQQELEKNP